MSLSTYADLQTQVQNWLARDDLSSYIPDAITLFEASAARRLRADGQEAVTSLTTSSGSVALPTGFLGARRLSWTGTPYLVLEYVSPQIYAEYYNTSTQGIPQRYTIEASTIKTTPIDDSTSLQLVYWAKTAALSGTLNWLWTNHPDAYLFGTLAEMNFFNKGNALQMASVWKQRRDEIFDEIRLSEFKAKPVGMAVRVLGVTP
jgi:hypothetical protein